MSGGQEKNFSTLGPKLRGSKAQQDYGDKQRQICIEPIDYRVRSGLRLDNNLHIYTITVGLSKLTGEILIKMYSVQ